MLRLQVQVKDRRLKVRQENTTIFSAPLNWHNEVEFEYKSENNSMMTWTSLLPDLAPFHARALLNLHSARYPVSEDFAELKDLCPPLAFPEDDEEWVFFGGTFNPWHEGHQACLDLLPEAKTCFVLPDINPYKDTGIIEPVPKVLKISARARFKKNQFLVPTFLLSNAKNPTVNWIERLKKDFPDKKLSLLLGHDSFASITSWIRAADLLPMLDTLYVVSRLETNKKREEALKKVLELAPELKVQFLGRHEFEGLSSTELRI